MSGDYCHLCGTETGIEDDSCPYCGAVRAKPPLTKPPETCALHGEKSWCECWQCGAEGVYGHDCGEDVCCCLDPEDNERCDICNGKGGWWRCYTCVPEEQEAW